MSEGRNSGSKITVRSVKQGNPQGDSDPRGVRIEFKESIIKEGGPNAAHLRTLLESKGYEVMEGAGVENTPFLSLRVVKGERQIQREEVLAILREDPDIDLPESDKRG